MGALSNPHREHFSWRYVFRGGAAINEVGQLNADNTVSFLMGSARFHLTDIHFNYTANATAYNVTICKYFFFRFYNLPTIDTHFCLTDHPIKNDGSRQREQMQYLLRLEELDYGSGNNLAVFSYVLLHSKKKRNVLMFHRLAEKWYFFMVFFSCISQFHTNVMFHRQSVKI